MKTLDPRTQAAVPGELAVSRRKFAGYFGRTRTQFGLLYLGSLLPEWGAPPVLGLKTVARCWLRTREHLKYGCLCPSIVLDRPKRLVATFTNLNSRGERSIPAIRIITEPLHLLPGELAQEGTQLASACIFWGSHESSAAGYWEDFSPRLVDCLVDDPAACASARDRLKKLAWTALAMGVAELAGKHDCGLHRVNVPHDVTWNSC